MQAGGRPHPTLAWFRDWEERGFSMNALYKELGISKQAVHQYARRQGVFDEQVHQLVLEADELRGVHPGCGAAAAR